ncbi:nickel/cobalt transporter [Maridesulfovibrio hydrothermalis]|uniref:nickel/cobalt transporter n=1 Tax=Maridesulfovibrio hydrothermalis TaxID=191026 RepID=UPI00215BE9FC|nr:nickel ABC transporter permease [Maridesulfovibrio hydrothermalis]
MIAPAAQSANNPFLTRSNEPAKQTVQPAAPVKITKKDGSGGIYGLIMSKVSLLQKEIRTQLTGFAREIKKNPYGKSLWLFMGFAFVYGIVHAVGPGHGKAVVCAYFLSRGGNMFTASFMSWVITLVHVGSAAVAVCLAYLFLHSGMSGFEEFNRHLQTASFALVTIMGIWLTAEALRSFKRKEEKCSPVKQSSLKEIITVALVTGLVPCPGAAIILVYTLSTGILWAGLIAMLFLATGMAVTTSLFAFTAAKTRCIMDNAAATSRLAVIYSFLSLTGALIIAAFGALMLSAHLA